MDHYYIYIAQPCLTNALHVCCLAGEEGIREVFKFKVSRIDPHRPSYLLS